MDRKHILIVPQIYVSLEEPQDPFDFSEEIKPRRTEIPMVWIQDGDNFRLDIQLPESSVLDVVFYPSVDSLHINGETIWASNTTHAVQVPGAHVEMSPGGLRLTCSRSGSIHILARCVHDPVSRSVSSQNSTNQNF